MNGLTQTRAKQIRALRQKKFREEQQLFLVEGGKAVLETLKTDWPAQSLVCTENFLKKNPSIAVAGIPEVFLCSEKQLSETGTFENNNAALLIARQIPALKKPDQNAGLWLALENISDPGNLGTLIRLADWFGLAEIITLGNVVEWYNPKVIAASMGSFLRIQAVKLSPEELFGSNRTILAADMNGHSIYDFRFPKKSVILIGNEANGLSQETLKRADTVLSIPSFGKAESLNAAISGGILLSHWKQQTLHL